MDRRLDKVPDTLFFAEHPAVYTLGRHADTSNILYSDQEIKSRGIEILRTTRGGQVTYHGPGQIVGYPIIKLTGKGKGVAKFVEQLETMLIATLANVGIKARTDDINRGVWIGKNKVAAIGIRVSGRVTMHGFSLNLNPDLRDYEGIVPCGIKGRGVTSLHEHGVTLTREAMLPILVEAFMAVFGHTGSPAILLHQKQTQATS